MGVVVKYSKKTTRKFAKTDKLKAKQSRQASYKAPSLNKIPAGKGRTMGQEMANTLAADRAAKLTQRVAKRKSKGW
jgi:hypothetical protein